MRHTHQYCPFRLEDIFSTLRRREAIDYSEALSEIRPRRQPRAEFDPCCCPSVSFFERPNLAEKRPFTLPRTHCWPSGA
jgi:hypothetical protein